jgi:hypothetical protein
MSKQEMLVAKFELARCKLAKAKAKFNLAKAVTIEAYIILECHKANQSRSKL